MSKPGQVLVVGTGRCGSTFLSRFFRAHGRVLSMSEFFAALLPFEFSAAQLLERRHLIDTLTRPRPEQSLLLRHNAEPSEYLYPVDNPDARYDRVTGVPPIALMALPHLSQDFDPMLDDVLNGIPSDDRTAATAFEQLFERLAADLDKDLWVERSGGSMLFVDRLCQLFPTAKYVHIHRDGPACAQSMAAHPTFRLMYFRQLASSSRRSWDGVDELQDAIASAVGREVTAELLLTSQVPVEWFGFMWSLMLVRGLRQLARRPRASVLHVAYEDLIAEPERWLAEIALFIDIEAEPTWIRNQASLVAKPSPSRSPLSAEERTRLDRACEVGRVALASVTAQTRTAG